MAMVGRGVCGRAPNPTGVYRELGERIRSTCPGVQHPETMRVDCAGEQRADRGGSGVVRHAPEPPHFRSSTSDAASQWHYGSIASCHSGADL